MNRDGFTPLEVATPRSNGLASSTRARLLTGFTIPEVLISIAVVSLVAFAIVLFQRDLFSINESLSEALRTEQQTGPVLKTMVQELRMASQSSSGGYALASLSSTTLTMYTNVDSDSLKERLRYFREGDTLKMGYIKPTGNPPVYNDADEKIKPMVRFLAATSTPLFSYYDEGYTGTTSPMVEPIDTPRVRLVKITLVIDKDPLKLPDPLVFSSHVLIRNLKDPQ